MPGQVTISLPSDCCESARETVSSAPMQKTTTTNTTTHFRPTARPFRLTCWAILAAAAFASLPAAFAQPSYFITELPVPAGYDSSVPYQINDQGFVSGASTKGSSQ